MTDTLLITIIWLDIILPIREMSHVLISFWAISITQIKYNTIMCPKASSSNLHGIDFELIGSLTVFSKKDRNDNGYNVEEKWAISDGCPHYLLSSLELVWQKQTHKEEKQSNTMKWFIIYYIFIIKLVISLLFNWFYKIA